MTWTTGDVADQTGRTAIITGSDTGLGFETARDLAANGARVVLAGRDAALALEEDDQARLWTVSEQLTGVSFPI